ncbi:hypothetical protein CMV_001854 [Castanea mollissima]|uniref:Uncharacterized protein n=1 Tax=Castanea mollissima TaxID=60419 RepID=A0A8J4RVE8_9ROSI|nr:hypothetical protein CMV_001854 [Castanea mollissima]
MLPLLDGILFCRNISGSFLRGYLAQELGQLAYLQELLMVCRILHGNNLIGIIPKEMAYFSSDIRGKYTSSANITGFCRSSQLQVADFSYNFLVGSIPKCLEHLPRWCSTFQKPSRTQLKPPAN